MAIIKSKHVMAGLPVHVPTRTQWGLPDPDELEARIDDLEARIEDLEDQVSDLLETRAAERRAARRFVKECEREEEEREALAQAAARIR